jgi:hypothetical protein
MEIKKKNRDPPQKYIGLKVHSLNCVFFKYMLLMIVENNNVKQFFEE